MSDYSVTNYNPNNAYDSLYVRQNQNVVASDTIPQQTTRTNYGTKVSLETPPDTFELSAESNIKRDKEKGMPTWLKGTLWVGGTAAAIYGCVVGHRAFNKPSLEKVAETFSKTFRKDISKEEAQKIADRYKEIFKIKDDKEFQDKLFNQLKKDYSLEHTNFGYTVKKLSNGEKGYFNPYGKPTFSTSSDGGTNIDLAANTCFGFDERLSRTSLFKTMVHEMNHAKQFELCCRTNWQEAIMPSRTKLLNTELVKELKEKGYDIEKLVSESLENHIGKMPKNDIAKGSKEYELGMKYIENNKNYIVSDKDPIGYRKQLVEAESYEVEDNMAKTLDYFLPIWRIF